MKRNPIGGLNLQQKVKDKVFYQALELLHDPDPKSLDRLNELIEENLKLRNSKPRTAPAAKTEKPSFLRSFSRDQPRNTLKNKPVAPAWTPTTKLISPSSLKTVRRDIPTHVKQESVEDTDEGGDLEALTEEIEAGFQAEEDSKERIGLDQEEEEEEMGKRKFEDMQGPPLPGIKIEPVDPTKRAKLTKSDDGFGPGLHNKRTQSMNKKLKEVKKRREVRMSRFG